MTKERSGLPEHGFQKYRPFFITLRGVRFGLEYSRVGLPGTPYLDRYIAYAFGWTFRLHKFWRGDDDRAPHDHPWDFWTFPLRSYRETVETATTFYCLGAGDITYYKRTDRTVKAFRLHFRPAKFRHIVRGRADGSAKPFWTFVVSRSPSNRWGFWPTPKVFVPYREWKQYVKDHNL